MELTGGITTIDTHGMKSAAAVNAIECEIRKAKKRGSVYRIRIIHGFHSGTAIRDAIYREFQSDSRLLRIDATANPGETQLVLREY